MHRDRLVHGRQRVVGPALDRGDQPAAAQARRDRPRAAEPAPARLELRLHLARRVQFAGEDERLRERRGRCRTSPARRCSSRGSFARSGARWKTARRVAERQRDEPEDVRAAGREREVAERRRLAATGLGMLARGFRPAEVGIDDCAGPAPGGLGVPPLGPEGQLERLPRRSRPRAASARRGPRARRGASARSSRARGGPRPCALELLREQPARLGELAVDYSCIPRTSSGVSSRPGTIAARSSASARGRRSRWTPRRRSGGGTRCC